jgi:DDE domain
MCQRCDPRNWVGSRFGVLGPFHHDNSCLRAHCARSPHLRDFTRYVEESRPFGLPTFAAFVAILAESTISRRRRLSLGWLSSRTGAAWLCCTVVGKRRKRFARPVGRSWHVDEPYVKIKGRWTYLYRAVDKESETVNFLLRAKRDVAEAKAFFRRTFRRRRLSHKITLDGYQPSHRAVMEVLGEHAEESQCKIRSSKYLNNLIEQITDRSGFGSVRCLAPRNFGKPQRRSPASNSCIRSGRDQFKFGKLRIKTKPRLRFGKQCLPRDPRQAQESLLGATSNVCATTVAISVAAMRRYYCWRGPNMRTEIPPSTIETSAREPSGKS